MERRKETHQETHSNTSSLPPSYPSSTVQPFSQRKIFRKFAPKLESFQGHEVPTLVVLLSHDNRDHFDQKAERSLPFITKSHAKQHLFDLKEKGGEFTVMIVVVVDDDDSDEFYLGGRRGIRPKHMCTVVYVLQPGQVRDSPRSASQALSIQC